MHPGRLTKQKSPGILQHDGAVPDQAGQGRDDGLNDMDDRADDAGDDLGDRLEEVPEGFDDGRHGWKYGWRGLLLTWRELWMGGDIRDRALVFNSQFSVLDSQFSRV